MERTTSFRDLHVWQQSMALTTRVYELSRSFPEDEKFGLTAQIRRASVSVPSNIAEGSGRRSKGEFLQFLGIATGSLREVETETILATMLGFVEEVQETLESISRISMMLTRLRQSVEARGSGVREPSAVYSAGPEDVSHDLQWLQENGVAVEF